MKRVTEGFCSPLPSAVPSNAFKVQESVERYVAEINADPSVLPSRGAFSKYVLEEGRQGTIELTWVTKGEDGIACNLESEGADALNAATEMVRAPLYLAKPRPVVTQVLEHHKIRKSEMEPAQPLGSEQVPPLPPVT